MWRPLQSFLATLSHLTRTRDAPSDSPASIGIVALLSDDPDRSLAARLCDANRWQIFFVNRLDEARPAIERLRPQIVLFDRDAAGAGWRDVMSSLASYATGACIILISTVLDDNLWNEVVCNGGYEVLPKPLREDEVSRAVRLAWTYWKSAADAGSRAYQTPPLRNTNSRV